MAYWIPSGYADVLTIDLDHTQVFVQHFGCIFFDYNSELGVGKNKLIHTEVPNRANFLGKFGTSTRGTKYDN